MTPAARTRTSTWDGPGSGRGSFTSLSTSGPPWTSWLIARMVFVVVMRSTLPGPARRRNGKIANIR
ncbi:hypothetical protein GCM10010273_49790 [Streptomyces lavendulocolor]